MTTCNATYTTTLIPLVPGACAAACEGVEFTVVSVASTVNAEGNYEFEWEVKRTKTDSSGSTSTTFSGEETVGCPGEKEIILYCDKAKNCPRFKLTLTCTQVQTIE